jgi:hypothetical protein
MLWQGREGETSGQWCALKGGSRGYIHGRGRVEKYRERGTKTSVVVGDKASGRQRSEREESSVRGSRDKWGGNREKPKIRGEGFRPSKEGVGGVGGVEERDRG